MKQLVNGQEVELSRDGAEVTRLHDRLMVRTASGAASAVAVRHGDKTLVSYKGRVYEIEKPGQKRGSSAAHSGEIHAPMPGVIVDVLVQAGDRVEKGQKLIVLEAMKTQQPMLAPFVGSVVSVPVAKGQQVIDGALLVHIQPDVEL